MKIFGKIRSSFGEKMLAGKAKGLVRNKQAHNFNTAKSVGIIFDAGNPEDFRQVKEFGKYLTALNIECQILGYLNGEVVTDDLLFLGNVNVFCNKDLDFFFRPTHKDALAFMLKKFDMLIDLSLFDFYPHRFISCLSPAVFKVGRYSASTEHLDFMIDINSKPTISFLIEQIKSYISILNNPSS